LPTVYLEESDTTFDEFSKSTLVAICFCTIIIDIAVKISHAYLTEKMII
jgi:hypothetical protein